MQLTRIKTGVNIEGHFYAVAQAHMGWLKGWKPVGNQRFSVGCRTRVECVELAKRDVDAYRKEGQIDAYIEYPANQLEVTE